MKQKIKCFCKNEKNKAIALILSLAMVLSLVPSFTLSAFAAGELTGGTQRTTTLDLTNQTSDLANAAEGWSWIYSTKTLTLSGANIRSADSSDSTYGINLPGGSTIFLAGGTTNIVQAGNSTSYYSYAIYSGGSITINGTGALQATGGTANFSRGIYASSSLTISGGTVTATGSTATGSYGIHAVNGINLNGGLVIARSGNATSVSNAMNKAASCGSGMTLLTGSNTANFAVYGESGKYYVMDNKSGLKKDGMDGYAPISGATGLDYTGTAPADVENHITWANKKLTLKNVIINVDTASLNSITYGIKLPSGSTITLADGTTNIVKAGNSTSSSYSNAIYSSSGSITINGTGALQAIGGTATSESYGIYAFGAVNISSGTVTAIGGTATNNSYGICTSDAISILGGKVTATGGTATNNSHGIVSDGVDISGGTGTTMGGTATTSKAFYKAPTFSNGYGITSGAWNAQTATWGKVPCAVTWNNDGATSTTKVTQGTVITLPEAPKKENYTFGGWWTETDGTGDQITESTKAPESDSVTYYAKWFATPKLTGGTQRTTTLDLEDTAYQTEQGVVKSGTLYTNDKEGWSYDTNTKTLTLSGVNIRSADSSTDETNGINLPGNDTIVLAEGTTNIVQAGNTTKDNRSSNGIGSGGDPVTINGTGTLQTTGGTANGSSAGIYSYYEVYILGGTVTATGGSIGINGCQGVKVSGGTVTATGGSTGIDVGYSTKLNGGLVIARSGSGSSSKAIQTDSTTLGSGMALLTGSNDANFAVYGESGKYYVIDSKETADRVTSGALAGHQQIIGARGLFFGSAETNVSNNYTWEKGTLTLKNVIINMDTAGLTDDSYGIYFDSNAKLTLEGKNIVRGGDTTSASDGIMNNNNSLTINGTGSLTSIGGTAGDDGSVGVFAFDTITVSDATVTAIGGNATGNYGISSGFWSFSSFEFKSGTISAIGGIVNTTNGESYGVYANDAINISGGAGTAISGTATTSKAFNIEPTFTNGYGITSGAWDSQMATWGKLPKTTPTITTVPTASDITYGQTLANSTLKDGVASVDGTFAFTTPTTKPTSVGTAEYEVTFTPTDTSKYYTVTCKAKVTVNKASDEVKISSDIGKTYDGNAVSAPTFTKTSTGAATIEYKVKGADDSTYSETAPKNAGDYTVRVTVAADDYYNEASATKDFNIAQRDITISGITASDKEYNGNTTATLKMPTITTAMGLVDGDSLTVTANGAFADKKSGTGKTVNITDLTLGGTSVANYKLATSGQQTTTTAGITAKELTVNVEVSDKYYDGRNYAYFKDDPSLVGVVSGDSIILINGTPAFASVNVGNNIAINFTAFMIGGTDARNYTLIQPTGVTANILEGFTPQKGLNYIVNSNDWLNQNFVITAKSGYKLSLTNIADETTWSDTLEYSDETNSGSVTFYVKEPGSGIISVAATENYKIDKTIPTEVELSYGESSFKKFLNTITFGLFFRGTVTVTLTSTDDLSGVKEFKYTLAGTEATITANDGEATFNIEPQYKGQISNVVAIDNAGNESASVATEYFAVDKNKPTTPSIDLNGYTSNKWTNSDVKFTVSGATANSGIAKYQYTSDGGNTWNDIKTTKSDSATATTPYNATEAELTISADTKAVSYIFRAVSNAGLLGATSASTVVEIDKTAPTVKVTGDTKTFKQSDIATITPTAGISEISKVEVKKNSGNYVDITSSYASGYKVTDNGTYTFKVTNGANVSETSSITYVNIDTAKPVVAINSNGYTENTWCNSGNIELSLSNSANNSGTTSFEYKIGNGNWTSYTAPIVISNDTKGTTYSFRATSASGVVSGTKTFTAKRDVTAPSGDITFNTNTVKKALNAISFGLLFKNTVSVNITGEDQTSGVSKIQYYKSSSVLTEADVKAITTWAAFDSLNITPVDKDKFVIYVKVTDNAGNVTYFGSNGATFDTVSPVISGITDKETYYTSQKVTVTDDNMSTITVNGNVFTSGNSIAGNIDKTYVIKATDKAGNETTVTVTMKTISSLGDSINSITADNVKSADKTAIESVKNSANSIDTANATDDEKAALNAITNNCDTLLSKIDDTANEIKRITDGVNAYSVDTVKSSDEANLQELISNIDNLLNEENITSQEKENLLLLKSDISSLLAQIEKSKNAINNDSVNNVSSINKDNVKISDKDALLEAKATLEDAINNHSDNYTDEELLSLNSKLSTINESLDKIDELEKEQSESKKDNGKVSPKTGSTSNALSIALALLFLSGSTAEIMKSTKKRKKETE